MSEKLLCFMENMLKVRLGNPASFLTRATHQMSNMEALRTEAQREMCPVGWNSLEKQRPVVNY